MAKLTDSEFKVSKILRNVLSEAIQGEPDLSRHLEEITLSPYIFNDNLPKIMVVTLPLELLIHSKLQYGKIMSALKKEFSNYILLTRRTGEVPSSKIFTPIKSREELIQDLVFPALISARTNEVESRDDMTQVVYLDSKNQCWSKPELSSIENLLSNVFEQNFRVRIFGAEI